MIGCSPASFTGSSAGALPAAAPACAPMPLYCSPGPASLYFRNCRAMSLRGLQCHGHTWRLIQFDALASFAALPAASSCAEAATGLGCDGPAVSISALAASAPGVLASLMPPPATAPSLTASPLSEEPSLAKAISRA
eukprot:CAMPEP_0170639646 /NCGR_PEP_ID=MMETSP0224-20130122/39772_1 /TAXON_ID=285029 /ORGANISM="Togula jolla, Strain CCCM 725" /LENGTH=136 /DNA_ID=CAMNT_0010970039 /DNA_START=327 /DNA_END=738 /DNA_ORIENTATION=-